MIAKLQRVRFEYSFLLYLDSRDLSTVLGV